MLHDGFFSQVHGSKIKCYLCPHNCIISEGQLGLCSVRTNRSGTLKTINYGEITSMAVDPIEKKPLYHFKPSRKILSVGSFGCNFSCGFCQNYSIAHYKAKSEYIEPDRLIKICLEIEGNTGIAFTYNEPSIWYEYVYEVSKKLKRKHPEFSVVLVTNGYILLEPLSQLLPYVDAMNIDLKSFQQAYYKNVCGGNIEDVLKTIEKSHEKCHVEVTTLLVNGLNDSKEEIEKIASFLEGLDKNIPLHLSRYFPSYKMDLPPTEIEVMLADMEIAKKHLNYVYLGNIANVNTSTYCPECGETLVKRGGLFTKALIDRPICPKCSHSIDIIL